MGLLLLIPGLILLLNGVTWFSGEESVGFWLTVIGGGLLALQVAIMVLVGWAASKSASDITRHSRNRRGF